MEQEEKIEIGVIVGRFQIDKPHEGHKDLIETVISNHNKVIIFLGVSLDIGNPNDPLDFHTRKLMLDSFIQESYPEYYNNIVILPLNDKRTNEEWSIQLDSFIQSTYPFNRGVLLYGGRDSFIKHYEGVFDTTELKPNILTAGISATDIRKSLPKKIITSEEYRIGVITRSMNEWPRTDMCADIAVLNEDKTSIVLGRKYNENSIWRFIGGHFDTRLDNNTEETAVREGSEELGGIEIKSAGFIGNFVIPSWRKNGSPNKILTNFYEGHIIKGDPTPSDDIYEISWFEIDKLNTNYKELINPEHLELWESFYKYYEYKYLIK